MESYLPAIKAASTHSDLCSAANSGTERDDICPPQTFPQTGLSQIRSPEQPARRSSARASSDKGIPCLSDPCRKANPAPKGAAAEGGYHSLGVSPDPAQRALPREAVPQLRGQPCHQCSSHQAMPQGARVTGQSPRAPGPKHQNRKTWRLAAKWQRGKCVTSNTGWTHSLSTTLNYD